MEGGNRADAGLEGGMILQQQMETLVLDILSVSGVVQEINLCRQYKITNQFPAYYKPSVSI